MGPGQHRAARTGPSSAPRPCDPSHASAGGALRAAVRTERSRVTPRLFTMTRCGRSRRSPSSPRKASPCGSDGGSRISRASGSSTSTRLLE